jgi:SapC protein
MGFENGENLFLERGQWTARYRPLALAIQPFLVGLSPEGQGPGQIHIDMGHPRIAQGEEGVRVFDEMGRPTPFLDAIAGRLGDLDYGYRQSADFFSALDRYELLEPFSLDIQLDDGSEHRLVGYHVIDEDKLRGLGSGELGELHQGEHLLPLFMAMASLSNIPTLVERKNRRAADA